MLVAFPNKEILGTFVLVSQVVLKMCVKNQVSILESKNKKIVLDPLVYNIFS